MASPLTGPHSCLLCLWLLFWLCFVLRQGLAHFVVLASPEHTELSLPLLGFVSEIGSHYATYTGHVGLTVLLVFSVSYHTPIHQVAQTFSVAQANFELLIFLSHPPQLLEQA